MQLIELKSVRHRLQVGVPLPFNVRQVDRTLLLARGQVVTSGEQMESLFERGMLVDIEELQNPLEQVRTAPAELLPKLWERSIDRVGTVLHNLPQDGFDAVLDDVAQPMLALVTRDPELAIFQVLRQHGNVHTQYGVNHSIHCAIAAFMSAHRLGWDVASLQRAFKVALTMNVSMLELQGQLATQCTPLTPEQREEIHTHPQRSKQMLELAGVQDPEWLQAVLQHHEAGDGSGYPAGLREVTPLAALIRQCDIYTAKLSPRLSREALAADVAARRLYADGPGDSMAAALIKEFGVYPPGCHVRLESGETGFVVRRGSSAHTPMVAALTTASGVTLSEPVRRDTARPEHAIVGVLGARDAHAPIAPEKLMALACG